MINTHFAPSSAGTRVAILYTTAPEAADMPEDVRAAQDLAPNARAVQKALRSAGYEIRLVPFGNDLCDLAGRFKRFRPNVVFNLAEAPVGCYAKEPHAAGFLELLGLPYTGNGPTALALCKNKAFTKQLLLANGVPTPRACVFDRAPKTKPSLTFPLVVKPLCEDGSFGITEDSVAADQAQLRRCVETVLREQHQPALVEEFVGGREFNVSVLGGGSGSIPWRVLPPGGYVYHSPRWRVCTFDAKWNEAHPSYAAVEAVYPAPINARLLRQLERITIRCAGVFNLTGYARLDFRLDNRGAPQLLDVNPNPDLAPGMGLARAAETAGTSYPELLGQIVRLGLAEGVR